jgi:hypothetical protein
VEKPDAFDSSWFTNRNGTDETFGCPLVEFRPRAAGIKFVPILGRTNPDRQIAVAFGGQLRGAGIPVALPIWTPLFHKSPFLT